MNKTIGENIAAIRKEKGITQEQLAKSVMVSAQAVSKWENGGMPDAELLPTIADCLGTTVDALFGRKVDDSGLEAALMKKAASWGNDEMFKRAFDICWDIEKGMMGDTDPEKNTIEDMAKQYESRHYSGIHLDQGFTQMSISKRMHYFLLVPEVEDKEKALFNGIDYVSLFKDLGDKNVFDTLVYLNKRDSSKIFTTSLLVKNFGMDEAAATGVINTLKKYRLVWEKQIELDDENKDVYEFNPTPSFIALLIFARELIERPGSWSGYCGGRTKPYLA